MALYRNQKRAGERVRFLRQTRRVGREARWLCLTRTGHSLNRRYSIASLGLLGAFLFLIPIDRSASSYQLLNLSFAGFFLDRLFSIAELLSFEGALAPSVFDNSPLLLIDPILRSFDDLVGAAEQTLLNLQSVGVSVLHR
jgi:hypothetical protein